MNENLTSRTDALHITLSITLSCLDEMAPGPPHTIVTDAAGNHYISDETQHRVISIDPGGRIRWQRGGKGGAPGKFHYPRGLSVGHITVRGQSMECLAVADAWNRRVQFLDMGGETVQVWTAAGGAPFSEITDVRFVEGGFGAQAGGSEKDLWLVLDRGCHRLHGITVDGHPTFGIGECLPPNRAKQWAVPEYFFARDARPSGRQGDVAPFDFVYFPERILGNSWGALFLWEPYRRSLKQVLPPHLLPIALESASEAEYIGADESGLLGWDPGARLLWRYDFYRGDFSRLDVSGIPIASSSKQIWIQDNERLELWNWSVPDSAAAQSKSSRGSAPLHRTGPRESAEFDSERVCEAIKACFAAADTELELACSVASIALDGRDPQQLAAARGRYVSLQLDRSNARTGLRKALHHWSLAALEGRLLGTDQVTDPVDTGEALRIQRELLGCFLERNVVAMNRMGCMLERLGDASHAPEEASIPLESRVEAISHARNDALDIQLWIGRCFGVPSF